MKSLMLVLSLTVLTLLPVSAKAAMRPDDHRKAAVTLATPSGDAFCSGTAVGKHTVLTVRHCLEAGYGRGEIKFGTEDHPKVGCVGDRLIGYDGSDNVLVSTCATFDHYLPIAKQRARVGDDVQVWGHPLGLDWKFRRGYVSAVGISDFLYPGKEVYFLDYNGAGGDSGSGVVNDKGEIICATSYIVREGDSWPSFGLMACFIPQFSDVELKRIG